MKTKLKFLLLITILGLNISCNGQNQKASTQNNKQGERSGITIGDTVSEMGKRIRSIFQDKKGNFWFGSDGEGLYRYDGKNLIIFRAKDGLCHQQIRTIQEDKAGNLWFGTGGGVSRFDGRTFTTIKPKKKDSSGSKSGTDWNIEPDDLWFEGDKGGVYRVTGDSMIALQFPKTHLDSEYYSKNPSSPISAYSVYSIFQDKSGHLWFGTQNLGVCRFDGKTFAWLTEKGLKEAAVRTIFQDKNGNFWFGNNGHGLFKYDGKKLVNITAEQGLGNDKFLKDHILTAGQGTLARVWSVNEDNAGDLWIATIDAGIWRLTREKLINYTLKDGLAHHSITAIYKDSKGELWLGTDGGGVCKFNGKTFSRFTVVN